jgi:2-succinyl-5-enolpyruvyl-6-hydroxy-3-cyclohexene-1-carboxylate synthase
MSVPTGGSDQATFAATLVDEWILAGLRDAVLCPGSRNTPLALALAARPDLRLHVRLDERSAGFFALGLALGSGRPALVCTTSGTAAAELHASVVEAHHAGVPLLVCTADRPAELQDVGAPQTIDQDHLYGRAVRWFAAPGVPDAAGRPGWRKLAARAYAEAGTGPEGPGPVHLNLAFREPLVGVAGPLPPVDRGWPRSAGVPAESLTPGSMIRVPDDVAGWPDRRGAFVAGAGCGPPAQVLGLADHLGWPVLADPRSGARTSGRPVVSAADAFLREPAVRRALLPEVVVLLGEPPAGKVIGQWLAEAVAAGAQVVAVEPFWRWRDPDRLVSRVDRARPAAWLAAVTQAVGAAGGAAGEPARGPATDEWLERWRTVEAAARRAIDEALLDGTDGLSEPAVAGLLPTLVPAGATLFASSSMPVRDLESFVPPLDDPPPVLANRGANGIDGVSSTARGVAAGGTAPVVALMGDLAFLHDVSGLVRGPGDPTGATCTLVVVDNGGGAIFSFLPQADAVDPVVFDRLFGTPQSTNVVDVAAGFGLPARDVASPDDLRVALAEFVGREELAVIVVRAPARAANVLVHRRLFELVGRAARGALGTD